MDEMLGESFALDITVYEEKFFILFSQTRGGSTVTGT